MKMLNLILLNTIWILKEVHSFLLWVEVHLRLVISLHFYIGETMFQNELFRIGGLKTLRGFDEESIFASVYSIFTLEYRFILEQNSYYYMCLAMAHIMKTMLLRPRF